MFYHPNCAIEKPHQMAAGGGRVEYMHEFQLAAYSPSTPCMRLSIYVQLPPYWAVDGGII